MTRVETVEPVQGELFAFPKPPPALVRWWREWRYVVAIVAIPFVLAGAMIWKLERDGVAYLDADAGSSVYSIAASWYEREPSLRPLIRRLYATGAAGALTNRDWVELHAAIEAIEVVRERIRLEAAISQYP